MTSPAFHLHQDPIAQAIAKLRCCTQVNIQDSWLGCLAEEHGRVAENEIFSPSLARSLQKLNARGHIAWLKAKELWLRQKLVIPQALQEYPLEGLCLRLALTWWAELAQIYVNGQLVQEGDLFDCSTRVLLSSAVTPGEEIVVALRLISPGHDDGALVRSLCVYESNSADCLEPGFVADELTIMQRYLETFAPENLPTLAAAVEQIDWSALPEQQKFERSLLTLRQNLIQSKIRFPRTQAQLEYEGGEPSKIFLLGHAHLDLAWLWPVSETWEAAQRTFTSALNLLEEYPELTFCHSTPALYAWIEQHRPDLFANIQQQVKAGRWEVVGGLWVEPELNTISGESIVRQLLYGQRYVQEKFGNISTVAWLPDSFGFCATLPQFLALGGIEYFVTQKLLWNDTTKFPYGAFWWRSPDGTELFSLMSAPIGEGIDPVKMACYSYDWEKQTSLQQALWLPGVGDHGGGPTRDMLEVAKRWQKSPFFPQLEFTTAEQYLRQIRSQEPGEKGDTSNSHINNCNQKVLSSLPTSVQTLHATLHRLPTSPKLFPVWNDELYLEFHRGCYTTHADQKLWNRRCEGLLYQAELFASLATLTAGLAYPKAELEVAWKQVLFNQFHDILPGSAINQVYVDANQAWQEAEQTATNILQQSLSAIASQIVPTPPHPAAQPIVVFNPLNWERSQVVEIVFPDLEDEQSFNWQICDHQGNELQSQARFIASKRKETGETPIMPVSFLANIPAVGYRVFWLCPSPSSVPQFETSIEEFVLENECLRVTVDPLTGDLSSIFDKTNQHEVLSGAGNQLQAFQDRGQYWDAWNIDPNYAQHPLPPAELININYRERGILRSCIQVVRKIGRSEFWQEYILEKESAVLKIETEVDWQERGVLVKAAFPLNLESEYATYEIPCGAITRPTEPQTPEQKAKWEVPALQWADISTDNYGVSLLNDCKYGYDNQPNQLRLTLLRSTSWPDPEADRGERKFTYALYPHTGTWQQAHTVRHGYELNLPLQVTLPSRSNSKSGHMPAVARLLDLSAENLILMAFKPSEDDPQQLILRCYECHGEPAQLSLRSDLGFSLSYPVDLLERSLSTDLLQGNQVVEILPWKIATFKVSKQ